MSGVYTLLTFWAIFGWLFAWWLTTITRGLGDWVFVAWVVTLLLVWAKRLDRHRGMPRWLLRLVWAAPAGVIFYAWGLLNFGHSW